MATITKKELIDRITENTRFFMVVLMCWILCAAITFGEAELALKERDQATSIDVIDIKDANYSPYLAYLKQNAKVPIQYVLDKFKKHDVVILGEMHEVKENLEFVRNLIEPLYRSSGVRCFVMETLKSKNNALINKLVTGKEYDQQLAMRLFRDTYWPFWGFKEYMDIVQAVWKLNHSLPAEAERFKIIGLEQDWDAYDRFFGSKSTPVVSRDEHMAKIVAKEVLEKNRKALVLIGFNHSFTHYKQPRLKDGKLVGEWPRFGYILYEEYGDRLFQICLHKWQSKLTKSSELCSLVGFIETMLSLNGNQPVGFDIENSPFAHLRDRDNYYFAYQKDVVFSDITQGYIFFKRIERLGGITWVNGFIDESNFEKAKAIAQKRGWVKPEKCNTPQQLDEKLKQIFEK
jgi:uncharacterized iron-regulated protein